MPSSNKAQVALIGFGLAGEAFHAPLVDAVAGLELALIVTGNEERASRASRRYPDTRVVASADVVWSESGSLDAVVIASPNRTHAPLAEAALENGLAVVVDKPLAASSEDGRRLVELAARRGLALSVFHNRRYDGDFLTVRRLLADGELGSLWRFESRFERWRPELAEGAWRELADPADAGGVLWDLGPHLIDQALLVAGPPSSVYAEVDVRRPGAQVGDDVFVALTHEDGVRSHLWMSQTAAVSGPRFRLLGSAGAYVKDGLDPQEAVLRDQAAVGGEDWGREPASASGELRAGDDGRAVETEAGDYPRYYEEFAAALRGEGPVPVSAEDGVRVLELIEAAAESARAGKVVGL